MKIILKCLRVRWLLSACVTLIAFAWASVFAEPADMNAISSVAALT